MSRIKNVALLGTCLCTAVLLLPGCGSAKKPKYSGFLRDYSQLKPDQEAEGALTYLNPKYGLANYDKFMIDPIRLHFAPGAKATEIEPDKIKEVSDHFASELPKALRENGYQVVQAGGPGVLRLRIALTSIDKTTAAWNIHPASKLTGLGTGGAAMEAEALDSQTGQRVAAIVDYREGARMSFVEGFEKTGHARQVVDHWIKRFITRVNKAHGKKS